MTKTIEFNFNNGKRIVATFEEGFDSTQFAQTLNNNQTAFITINDYGFIKHSLVSWGPVDSEAEMTS